MKTVSPSPAALAAREDLLACLQRHAAQMDALELLGVLSYTVGQFVAFQDQRTVTAAMAMEVVARNIEAGNASALSPLLGPAGGSA